MQLKKIPKVFKKRENEKSEFMYARKKKHTLGTIYRKKCHNLQLHNAKINSGKHSISNQTSTFQFVLLPNITVQQFTRHEENIMVSWTMA